MYVEVLNDVETVVRRTRTDGGGSYFFGNLGAGRYFSRVRPFGTNYEEQTQEVEINTFIGGRQVADAQYRDFYLKVRKTGTQTTGAPGVVFAQQVPEAAKRAYDRAVSEIDAKRVDAGIAELRNAVNIFPEYFQSLDLLGIELLKQQKYEEAVPFLERALAVNEKSGGTWYGLAFCYSALNRPEKAVDAAKRAANFSHDSADVALILGISLRMDKQFTDAEKALVRAKSLSSGKNADVLWNLALLYAHDLKNLRRAADELESYLKLRPDHPNAESLRKLIQQYRAKS
jgi:tetratricopeptide (TPR) repeat protein